MTLSRVVVLPCELDAAHEELLAFVHVDVEEDQLFLFVEVGVGNGREVDVAQLAICFAQILQTLADFLAVENVAVLDREQAAQAPSVLAPPCCS